MSDTLERPSQGISFDEAKRITEANEEMWNAHDLDRILGGMAEDIVVRYSNFPEMRGRSEVERWLRARFARQRGYQLKKTLMTVTGDVVGGCWEGSWEDAQTGAAMLGRGTEFLKFHEGQLVLWIANFSAWSTDGSSTESPLV